MCVFKNSWPETRNCPLLEIINSARKCAYNIVRVVINKYCKRHISTNLLTLIGSLNSVFLFI